MIDLAQLRQWVGKTETHQDEAGQFAANALAATLNHDRRFDRGDALPPLYHWLYTLPLFRLDQAGYDGHAALGGFLPPVPLPRRMWAGGRLRFYAPIRVGDHITKTSRIQSVDHKSGRSGDLVFVTVRHEIATQNGPALCEDHDIVYRAAPSANTPKPVTQPARDEGTVRRVVPDPVLLFRYSALTFNGHRIHYDRPFCESEGYDGLVVHGPLLATLLLDHLTREYPDRWVTSFDFRAKATVTDGTGFGLHLLPDGDRMALWVRRSDGALAMEAEAETAPRP